jgi:hypothetical protein
MTSAILLDHVSAYASAVRAHLADLSPEQVEDLTDGLEADLAEALEDREGPVVTGEIPIGRAAAAAGIPAPPGAAPGASMIDLTRRFGPADAYAAELRAAAGLAPGAAAPRGPRQVLGARLAGVTEVATRLRRIAVPAIKRAAGSRLWSWVLALRPLWWLVRGWLWFVIVLGIRGTVFGSALDFGLFRFIPRSPITWATLIGLLLLSVAVGRGLGSGHRWARIAVATTSAVAILTLPWSATELKLRIDERLAFAPVIQYVEVPAAGQGDVPAIEDGVYVDGMMVSNLFVYDAAGNPLEGVQIYDDRGRQVRTMQTGWADWELPGVAETWRFIAAQDGDGRNRWNVYPLMGAPSSSWDTEAGSTLLEGEDLRLPPLPFAKAPAVAFGTGHDSEATDG